MMPATVKHAAACICRECVQRIHPYDFMLHFCRIEGQILELKKVTCTGNMLQGHVVKPIEQIDLERCRAIVAEIQEQLNAAKPFFTPAKVGA